MSKTEIDSRSNREVVSNAAWQLILEGDVLARLGLTASEIEKEAKKIGRELETGVASYHLKHGNVVKDLVARVVFEMTRSGEKGSSGYSFSAEAIGDILGKSLSVSSAATRARELIGTALRRDVVGGTQYDRLWYLLIAIADLNDGTLGKDVDVKRSLAQAYDDYQSGYELAYDAMCEMSGRTYATTKEQTMQAVNAFLEGVVVQSRFGRGPGDDELVEAVVRIFWAFTKPLDGSGHNIDKEMFGKIAGGADGL